MRKKGLAEMYSFVGKRRTAPGILLLRSLRHKNYSVEYYRTLVLTVTFIAYACYHASRKPPSIVKSVLDPQASSLHLHPAHPSGFDPSHPWALNLVYIRKPDKNHSLLESLADGLDQQGESGWPPFDGKEGKSKLGEIDLAFLAAYAFGMYFSGHLGDRLDLRNFLSIGMLGSAAFVCLFGFGYFWKIHVFSYYFVVQTMAGLFQATGWPSVVAIMGNWFGKSNRGLIMGIWNAHTSLGNILGSVAAASMLQYGWGWCFVLPGVFLILAGAVVYLFLVVDPSDVDLPSPYEDPSQEEENLYSGEKQSLFVENGSLFADVEAGSLEKAMGKKLSNPVAEDDQTGDEDGEPSPGAGCPLREGGAGHEGLLSAQDEKPPGDGEAVGFLRALAIPGVAQFALCLFFSKLVAYTFLYWLPFYIRNTKIAGEYLSDETAGNLSTLFDMGGVVGGILAGHISDSMNARATTAAGFTFCAIPMLFFYNIYGDLGTHSSLKGNAKALATVTAIIDGTGSVGAAAGPLLTGYISQRGWNDVFFMLMLAALLAGLSLSNLIFEEMVEKFKNWRCEHGKLTQSLLTGRDQGYV
ncbi:hypothetical protein O6H91_10G066000 [Diphasiastrum complanatum]|uniref:Uncharacterized protein n=1 Tax=Diphasiastrum complanatum TaxID=34168 RepID=A0ACC2CI03_DIPCM|nr:hypothetical protein O6H91_10G066000 [Diphasiastrum complanatum]